MRFAMICEARPETPKKRRPVEKDSPPTNVDVRDLRYLDQPSSFDCVGSDPTARGR